MSNESPYSYTLSSSNMEGEGNMSSLRSALIIGMSIIIAFIIGLLYHYHTHRYQLFPTTKETVYIFDRKNAHLYFCAQQFCKLVSIQKPEEFASSNQPILAPQPIPSQMPQQPQQTLIPTPSQTAQQMPMPVPSQMPPAPTAPMMSAAPSTVPQQTISPYGNPFANAQMAMQSQPYMKNDSSNANEKEEESASTEDDTSDTNEGTSEEEE